MVRLAASQASLARPLVPKQSPLTVTVLVWGDSAAGLKASLGIGRGGLPGYSGGPKPGLNPLVLGISEGEIPNPTLWTALVRQAQEHHLIKTVCAAHIGDFGGVAGNFTLRLDTPQGSVTEQVGAVVLAPDCS